MSNSRGKAFEQRLEVVLRVLESRHPELVSVGLHPRIRLASGASRVADFELTYKTDQEHHELIECQSRKRSSADLSAKIREMKSLTSRNRFLFVFEDVKRLADAHRRGLEQDGVNVLSFEDFQAKVVQLDAILVALEEKAGGRMPFEEMLRHLRVELARPVEFGDGDRPYRGKS